MRASEIRTRFLQYFERQGHSIRPSSALVPGDDPTLLFTNAGMVQFKKVFLGHEDPPEGKRRVTTSQKCVRAGGKHNDLEQVGHTARHHTFFEMLGNFSFGDYFKRDAIRFAWEFVTVELKLPKEHLRVTVFETDDEARQLWKEISGLADDRIYGLGAKDNFWQMADTGPCGPCTEIYVDLAHMADDFRFPAGAIGEWTDKTRTQFGTDAFVEGAEAGRFLEIWNLVFMQYDRQADGTLVPLPKPSVDTGAGLERIAAVMQRVSNNFHTDRFAPLLERAQSITGLKYHRGVEEAFFQQPDWIHVGAGVRPHSPVVKREGILVDPAAFRVLADHARAVAFLLADGVNPANEGRGYVLRRILRRGVRFAWLLGRVEPTLVEIVQVVVDTMGEQFAELRQKAKHIIATTRAEEERFLATIDAGMRRFDELAPPASTQGSTAMRGTVSGEDAFRLYDTFGFPIDLTELMARERGYLVDIAGFESALDRQRTQSQDERKARKLGVSADELGDIARWESATPEAPSRFVGYDAVEIETQVTAVRRLEDGRVAVLLLETPFYAESGGQVSDHGEIVGDGWKVTVEDVRKVDGRNAAVGRLEGTLKFGTARALVPGVRRRDTERNHTATHLLHAALRTLLGEHVHQAGSLVAPDRLRFDFTHHGPVKPEQLAEIEAMVNAEVWKATPVITREMAYQDAVGTGAMALFGEKYGDVVRVVSIPGFSMELCGGTHVRNTSEIGVFRIVGESGVAAGVRRIEAVTARGAYELGRQRERTLQQVAEVLKAPADQLARRVGALVEERRALEKRLEEALRGGSGGSQVQSLIGAAQVRGGARIIATKVDVGDMKALQALGDALREQMQSGIAVLAASTEGKHTLLVVVTDDLRDKGVRADTVIKEIAAIAGGRGGGKQHMAQAGIPDATRIPEALAAVPGLVSQLLGTAA